MADEGLDHPSSAFTPRFYDGAVLPCTVAGWIVRRTGCLASLVLCDAMERAMMLATRWLVVIRMTLGDFERQQNFQRHGASSGLSATAELLVYGTIP